MPIHSMATFRIPPLRPCKPHGTFRRGLKERDIVKVFDVRLAEQTVRREGLAFHPLGGHGANLAEKE